MARIKDDYRGLTGMQKVGIFMLAVGNAHSAQLFEKMDDEEIRDLSGAMSSLGTINAGIIERLFVDRVRRSAELGRRLGRLGRLNGTLADECAARRKGFPDHGRDARPRRAHHVGQAWQCE